MALISVNADNIIEALWLIVITVSIKTLFEVVVSWFWAIALFISEKLERKKKMKVIFLLTVVIGIACARSTREELVEKEWWETALLYQIYPRSFKDTTKSGIGDIQGVISKLQYLNDTGVDGIWLSPIFKSPQVDFGYDISDFKDIDEIFGTMADMEELFAKAKEHGIKVILDFVPNHTSDEHEWFVKSVDRVDPYTDYYIWRDGVKGTPPNNWVSVFRGSAWEWSEKRNQFYLHQFAVGQPDLNFRNPAVKEEMVSVLEFWMEKGASGFRVDAINHMFESENFEDEPLTGSKDPEDYGYTHHDYTKDLLDTYEVVAEWRKVLDDYAAKNKLEPIVMMTEAYANFTYTLRYYESDDGTVPRAHFPFNFLMIENLHDTSDANDFKNVIDMWLENMPRGKTANWVLGNHDKSRVGSRYGAERIDGMLMLTLTLPGVAVTYNGEEIGMLDHTDISFADSKDPQGCNAGPDGYKGASRDPQRTPFQWDDTQNAGFSSGKPWLPVYPLYRQNNLLKQTESDYSHYHFYQDLATIRKHHIFTHGEFKSRALTKNVLGFVRYIKNSDRPEHFVVLINLSDVETEVNINDLYPIRNGSVVHVAGTDSKWRAGDIVNVESVVLGRYDSLIIGNKSSAMTVSISFALLIFSVVKQFVM